jgi:peptide/nickel transport system permease protein
MPAHLLRRLATLLLSLLAATALIFALLEVLPGNVAQLMLGSEATPEAVAALAEQLGLQRPAALRYLDWLAGLAHGEMGLSHVYGAPVAELIAERLVVTLPLALLAMALAALIALAAGSYAAARRGRPGDLLVMLLSQVGLATPSFWFAILLMLLFAVKLQWVSAGGFPGWRADEGGGLLPGLQALALPALALALTQAAILARITRSALLEVLGEDYVRSARAAGASEARILLHHALRNALIPIVTVMGLQFANLLAGTIVVESIFQLPGLGRLLFQAVANRDLMVLRNGVLLLVALVLLLNFAVDLLYLALDPRLRRERDDEHG